MQEILYIEMDPSVQVIELFSTSNVTSIEYFVM